MRHATEGERLDQKKREARARADARREKEAQSPSEYQEQVIRENVAAISKNLEAITTAGLDDKTTLVRREVMRFLLFFKRHSDNEKRRISGMQFEEKRKRNDGTTE